MKLPQPTYIGTITLEDAIFAAQPPQGERGVRYAYIETGALTENVYLQATALELGVVLVGGFEDDKVKLALHIPSKFEVTTLLCVGKP